ncbi:RNA demethylase ALKBH9B-like isoform X1 [Lycium ferocissimum]|uniref:RNA demethylase ALKBH9B-like isoform X1 n=1 Tax=Lycium ferocissimum TaxID=112874 RepID=UPI0028152DE8|nr:RNA demethylase ALKBH9B-like isoform X1 [Lycium ferocissimum]
MARDFRHRSPDFMAMLKNLSREEILQVLSEGLCPHCEDVIEARVCNLNQRRLDEMSLSNVNVTESSAEFLHGDSSDDVISPKRKLNADPHTPSPRVVESTNSGRPKRFVTVLSTSVNSKQPVFNHSNFKINLNDGPGRSVVGKGLSEEQDELIRFRQVGRRKDFVHYEKVFGKEINVLQGLELHTQVFNPDEQREIVELVYTHQRMGQKGQLRARTYSEPRKWMKGKGRVTLQFGCCYNYAVDKDGNPPGIIRDEEVDPLPPLFKKMIRRMVRWHVLPPSCVPDSCIVNIYDEGDCIPPHIDHHDFVRPFCTVSFLAECNIVFGTNLKIISPGEFSGPFSLPLPLGSVLIINGNGADVAKHCVPSVPAKRISITFRKMDVRKLPYSYAPGPELSGFEPLVPPSSGNSRIPHNLKDVRNDNRDKSEYLAKSGNKGFSNEDEFPPLGKLNSSNRRGQR